MADDQHDTFTPLVYLTPADVHQIIGGFPIHQLRSIVVSAFCRGDQGTISDVRAIADLHPDRRKILITSLAKETGADTLSSLFSLYGEVEQAQIDIDRYGDIEIPRGTGSVTFRHADGAVLALKEPSKRIHGRMTFSRRFTDGGEPIASPFHYSFRMIFVANVHPDMRSDRLVAYFSSFGAIEEGPLGIDPLTGKFMGFAIFIFKNMDGMLNSLMKPMNIIDGHDLLISSVSSSFRNKGAILGVVPQPDHVRVGGVVTFEQGFDRGSDVLGGFPLIKNFRGSPFSVMYYPLADPDPGQMVPGGEMHPTNIPKDN